MPKPLKESSSTTSPTPRSLSDTQIKTIRRLMLAWYHKHKRDLPWRTATPNPYATFVSEAMLQQTQVATVIAYFNRFLRQFPTVEDLANADEEAVLKLWEGLGYYRRARNLHAAAKQIVDEFDGVVPSDVPSLLTLPGVGQYTAGAVASIAYGQPAPIVDGNVERVLARWFCIESDFANPKSRQPLWALAEQLVQPNPKQTAGDFNQSMMELGATVCTPKQPQCLVCPVQSQCQAFEDGRVDELPIKKKRVKPKPVTHTVLVVEHQSPKQPHWLITQRPDDGLWAGLFEHPTIENTNKRFSTQEAEDWLHQQFGIRATFKQTYKGFKHATTHRSIQFQIWLFKAARKNKIKTNQTNTQWLNQADLAELPLSNPQKKITQTYLAQD